MLRVAATLERGSEHPLAQAVLARGEAAGIRATLPQDFRAVAGRGVAGLVDGVPARLGSIDFIADLGVAKIARRAAGGAAGNKAI